MLLLFLLLLLSIRNEVFSLDCAYSAEPFESSIIDFDFDLFKSKINEYPNYDYKDDNINMCRAEIFLDYKSDLIIISFADSFEWYEIDNGEARLDFLIIFDQNNSDVQYYNQIQYACYDQDQCDKIFVFNHTLWLLQANYSIIQTHLRSLLFNNSNPTEYCYTDKTNLIKCSTGVCVGKYAEQHKIYLFDCHKNPASSVEIHITTSMIVEKDSLNQINIQQDQMIRYICKYNKCNQQYFTDSVVNIIQTYYQLNQMKYALGYNEQQHSEQSYIIDDTTLTDQITLQISSTNSITTTTTIIINPFDISNISQTSFSLTIYLILFLLFLLFIRLF